MADALLILIVVLALFFDFVNGFHDTANAIATSVMTSAIRIPYAILMAAVLNFMGALLNTRVAETIGGSIVEASSITPLVLLSALIAAIAWNLLTWRYGLPSSSSHALIGSLVGVALAMGAKINPEGLFKIVLALVISPLLGLVGGLCTMILFYRLFRNSPVSKTNRLFRRVQLFSAGFMALSHGGNDAQKAMAIITLTLVAGHLINGPFQVPEWVKLACATAMALGTAVGGWRIIRTVGRGIIELRPIQGCAAETVGATVIQAATHLGLPVSTTHVITSAICGVGAAENIYKVNWNVMKNIVFSWFLTLPVAALFAAIVYRLLALLI